jgi:hypothetical protein
VCVNYSSATARGTGARMRHPVMARKHSSNASVALATGGPRPGRLLYGSGGWYERRIDALGAAADPGAGTRTTVDPLADQAGVAAGDLTDLLHRASRAPAMAACAPPFRPVLGIRDQAQQRRPPPAAARPRLGNKPIK